MSCPCQSSPCFFTWNLENAPIQTPQVAFGLSPLASRGVWQCDCLLFLSFFFDVGLIYLTHNKVNPHFFGKVKTNILAAFRTIFMKTSALFHWLLEPQTHVGSWWLLEGFRAKLPGVSYWSRLQCWLWACGCQTLGSGVPSCEYVRRSKGGKCVCTRERERTHAVGVDAFTVNASPLVKCPDARARALGSEYWLCYFLIMWLWASYWVSLFLRFTVYQVGTTMGAAIEVGCSNAPQY